MPSIVTRPAGRVVEPRQELHERGFAAAVGADDGDRFAGADVQVDAAQDRLVGMVVEADVFELERVLERRQRDWLGRIDDRRLAVEDFVHAVGGGDGLLDVAELAGEAAGRVAHAGEHREEDAHVAVREGDVADLDAEDVRVLAEHEVAAHHGGDEHDREAKRFDRPGSRARRRWRSAFGGDSMSWPMMELVALGRLHREDFDELDAAQRFGERFVDRSRAPAWPSCAYA